MKNLLIIIFLTSTLNYSFAQNSINETTSGFFLFNNIENDSTKIYLSPIQYLKSLNSNDSIEILKNDFAKILQEKFHPSNLNSTHIYSHWYNQSFITTNQFNNLLDLIENTPHTHLIIVSNSDLTSLPKRNEKSIVSDKNYDVLKEKSFSNSKDVTQYILHPYQDYVGCRDGIYLGTFNSREACNKAGKSRFGSNGSWCCLKK